MRDRMDSAILWAMGIGRKSKFDPMYIVRGQSLAPLSCTCLPDAASQYQKSLLGR
jgi:hypothetical protein